MSIFHRAVIKTLLSISGSSILKYMKDIEKSMLLSENAIARYQEGKLKKMLLHCWANVPYYRAKLEESKTVVNGKVQLENYGNLPFLTKDIIRTEGENLLSKDASSRSCYKNSSGGSTGEPVLLYQDQRYDEWNIATKLHFFQMYGKKLGDKEIKLWGSDRDIIKGRLTSKESIINHLYNRKFFNSYRFGDTEKERLYRLHEEFKPVAYWAYMDALVEFSKYVLESRIVLTPPKYVISTIGPLSDKTRKLIEKAFRCNVYNQYGSRELGWVASEVQKADMLVGFWRNIVELIRQTTGEYEIVVTTLENYSMPLLRYKVGDIGLSGNSKVKVGPIESHIHLGNIKGRTLGFFVKEDGSLIHSHFFVQQFFFRKWIKKFKIIQKDVHTIECIIVGYRCIKEMKEIEKYFRMLTRPLKIQWKFVDNIEPLKSGKFNYTESLVVNRPQ